MFKIVLEVSAFEVADDARMFLEQLMDEAVELDDSQEYLFYGKVVKEKDLG